jgi:FlaA1/EpsC-like NDP-sugar epimerase
MKSHKLQGITSKLLFTYYYIQQLRDVDSVYPGIDPSHLIAQQAFQGKCVIVTGASRGIGGDAALTFARAGASVVLVARNELQLTEAETRILEEVPKARLLRIAMDVMDPTKAETAVARTVELFGGIDVLVAAAGRMRPANAGGPCLTTIRCRG